MLQKATKNFQNPTKILPKSRNVGPKIFKKRVPRREQNMSGKEVLRKQRRKIGKVGNGGGAYIELRNNPLEIGKLEKWKTGKLENNKTGKREKRKTGKQENRKSGKLEHRKSGKQ